MCVGNSKCGGKGEGRRTDVPQRKKKNESSVLSSCSSDVSAAVPLWSHRGVGVGSSALLHAPDGRSAGRSDDDDNGWSQGCARKRRRKDQLFFSRVQPRPPSLPPHLFRPLRFAEFSTWAGFRKKREKPYTPRSPHTTFEKEAVLCQILSEAEGNDCFFAPFLCRVRAA